MVTRQAKTTVTFQFSDLSSEVVMRGGTRQVVTDVMLSWTTDLPVLPKDSPYLNYGIRGQRPGSCRPEYICFPSDRAKWEFLSVLAEQIDHPEIQAELHKRIAKEIRETA
jgi:hypothetical protein